jgi:integrase
LERAAEKAKLEIKVQPHMLRHACGFKLVNDGTDTRSLQAYLGHKNIQHTVRYTELSPGEPMADWNSALYMKFENERTRAVRDLLARIPEFEPDRIFDLGCGPGNGTELLAAACGLSLSSAREVGSR